MQVPKMVTCLPLKKWPKTCLNGNRGLAILPCKGSWFTLHQFAIAANEKMRRHPQPAEVFEVGVGVAIELVAEELFHLWSAELAGWQTDGVDDDEADLDVSGARAEVG